VATQKFACSKPDCTFAITGTCVESIDDPTRRCPNLRASESLLQPEIISGSEEGTKTVNKPARQFPSGLEVGLQDAARLMQSRYTRVVGVLGQSDAGKTCLFTSLYLQLTNRHLLPKYRFAGSHTLQGFEQRARHLRDWSKGYVPDQIVDRTHLGTARSPAFLHIAIQDDCGVRHDFLLPDLPGEWTTRLLSDATTASRFAFLRRSDVVLIVLEAPQFAGQRTRNNAIADATHLIARLADEINVPTSIPVILAVTKCDQTNSQVPAAVEQVAANLSTRGYKVATVPLAVFPQNGATVQPGYGIDVLIDQMSSACQQTDCQAPQEVLNTRRSYLNARGHQ
jgi:hypothetical protein